MARRTQFEKVQDIRAGLIAERVIGLAAIASAVLSAVIFTAFTT